MVAMPTPGGGVNDARSGGVSTFEHGAELGDERHAAGAQILADGHFLEEDRDPAEDHRGEVDNQESA